MSEVPTHEHTPRGEWRNFTILVIILVGVILVVALLRPLIFNRIVPAILGENLPQTTEVEPPSADGADSANSTNESENGDSSTTDEKVDEDEEMSDEEMSDDENASSEESGDDAETEEDEAEETAADDPDQQTHTVEFGQNLVQIARRYGVTVDELIEANDIANPDIVRIGDVLVIPSK